MSNVVAATMLFMGRNQALSREQRMRLRSGSYTNKRVFVHDCRFFTRNERVETTGTASALRL
jgi:hypothetical protein